jgi:hypothetical protein
MDPFAGLTADLILRAYRGREAWRRRWADRCDWAAAAELRRRSASGEMARDLAALDAIAECKARARLRAETERIAVERTRLGLGSDGGGDVFSRASRYLSKIDAGPNGLFRAAQCLTRGWALSLDAALDMLAREYVPRYHRKVPQVELIGTVRRAARSERVPLGHLLNRSIRP